MKQWDGLTSKISDFWQQSRAFLWLPVFSNNNNTEVSGKVFLSTSNVVKLLGGWDSAPDPAEGAYSAPPDPLAGGRGLAAPSPRTPLPLLAQCWIVSHPQSWNPQYAPEDTTCHCRARQWSRCCSSMYLWLPTHHQTTAHQVGTSSQVHTETASLFADNIHTTTCHQQNVAALKNLVSVVVTVTVAAAWRLHLEIVQLLKHSQQDLTEHMHRLSHSYLQQFSLWPVTKCLSSAAAALKVMVDVIIMVVITII